LKIYSSVIADLGGLLGLFMGCSLLSIVELFYFLANGSSFMFQKCQPQKPPQVWATKSTPKESTMKESTLISSIDNQILSALNKLTMTSKDIEKQVKENEKQLKELRKQVNGLVVEMKDIATLKQKMSVLEKNAKV
jgi:hypothetical protein